MWDVKIIIRNKAKSGNKSFTLTMWDVKMINSALVPFVNILVLP